MNTRILAGFALLLLATLAARPTSACYSINGVFEGGSFFLEVSFQPEAEIPEGAYLQIERTIPELCSLAANELLLPEPVLVPAGMDRFELRVEDPEMFEGLTYDVQLQFVDESGRLADWSPCPWDEDSGFLCAAYPGRIFPTGESLGVYLGHGFVSADTPGYYTLTPCDEDCSFRPEMGLQGDPSTMDMLAGSGRAVRLWGHIDEPCDYVVTKVVYASSFDPCIVAVDPESWGTIKSRY